MAYAEKNPVSEKSLQFAILIVDLCALLKQRHKGFVLTDQLLRSGTSIGANVEEALGSFSRKDFLWKMNLAYKEARETNYWLKVIYNAQEFKHIQHNLPIDQVLELQKIIGSICRYTRKKLNDDAK
jgi:four helix bundle protein